MLLARTLLRSALLTTSLAAAGLALAQTGAPPAPGGAAPAPAGDKVVARVDGDRHHGGRPRPRGRGPGPLAAQHGRGAEARPARRLPRRPQARRQRGGGRQGRRGAGLSPRKLAYFRDKLLLDEYLDREVKKAVTPEAARKLYDDTVKNLTPEQEVRARHILVESEDEAKKAAARVKGGEDFAKVAGELSKDPGLEDRRRRSRLLHQGAHGAALRRGRLQARARPDLGAGEEPVRLARHQARGEAHASRCRPSRR